MDKFLAHVKNWHPLVAIIGVVGLVIWYIAGLDGRVRQLELRVHALTVAPTIVETNTNVAPKDLSKDQG